MNEIFTMFPTVGCLAVICFIIGQLIKLTPLATKYVPVIVAIAGGILGVVGQMAGVAELANMGIFDAIATGICTGLVASGGYSLVKNLTGAYPENELSKKEQNELDGEDAN